MTTSKMTSRTALTYVLTECSLPEDVREKLTAMVAALDKKSATRSTTPTKKQIESTQVRERIMAVLDASGAVMSIPEIAERVGLTTGSASSHLSILKREGRVMRSEVKGRAYFASRSVYDDVQALEDEPSV